MDGSWERVSKVSLRHTGPVEVKARKRLSLIENERSRRQMNVQDGTTLV